jgi:tRNA1Val (adenine37-N6)-methyltransferase
MNSCFRFKQFSVYHDKCAMKVGTDGVLLGAWADCSTAKRLLDVGTGSGLIALMLAQRSHASIDAIDLDENAYLQAKLNFEQAPFRDRLTVYLSSLQDFTSELKYDRIVCNPPYFSHSLQSPDKSRTCARHNDTLSLDELVQCSRTLLSEEGKLSLILPFAVLASADRLASEQGLFPTRKTCVRPLQDKPPKRILLEYSTDRQTLEESDMYIEKARHVYSEEYRALTQDFYLALS